MLRSRSKEVADRALGWVRHDTADFLFLPVSDARDTERYRRGSHSSLLLVDRCDRTVVIIVTIMAARSAPRRLAAKVKLRLPKAMPLKARSAQLSVKQILPSSRKRANSSQRLSMQFRLWDLGGAGEGFALSQQPDVHVLEKRLAFSWRTARRSSASQPLMVRSISNNAWRCLTAPAQSERPFALHQVVDRADRDGSGERLLGHAQALQETRKIGGFADALDRLCERACAALSLGHLQVSQVQARLSSGSMVLVLSQTVIRLTMADGFSRLGPHSRACRL